jgi:hypothetical protein
LDDNTPKDESNEKRPFYSRFGRKDPVEAPAKEKEDTPPALAVATVAKETTPVARPAPWAPPSPPKESLSPAASRAASLRAQAKSMRLEAERMDLELTLKKIAGLERKLAYAKSKETKGEGDDLDASVEDLRRELEILANKMSGEETPKASATITAPKPAVFMAQKSQASTSVDKKGPSDTMQNIIGPFSAGVFS